MRSIVKKNILKIKPYVPGKPIEEVKRELGLKSVIKLASNENPYGPSKKVLEAIRKESPKLNRYPESGCYYLRCALAKRLKVRPNQLIFGNGSDEIIVMVTRAFVEKGDEVVIAKPSFLIYEIAALVENARVRSVPLKDFRYDLDGMKDAISQKTKIIFIGNPDNPAGTYVTQKELVAFLKQVRSNILIFIDEAYFEYVKKSDYPDTIALLKQYKNIIVTRTFSKMYALAGLRIGYGIANEEIIDCLNRVREPFNINSLAQAAAVACLKDQKYYNRIAKESKAQKEYLYAAFKHLGLCYLESATNFILIDMKKNSSSIINKLLRKGIIVRDMKFWGLNHFIRVSVGTKKENQKLLTALKEVL